MLPIPHVAGHPDSVASSLLQDGPFTPVNDHAGRSGKNFVAKDSSRMIAGNVFTNTKITGIVHQIEIHDYGVTFSVLN